jgi:WD40 repeat protein
MYRVGANLYTALADAGTSPQAYVTRALGLLEAELRALALLALSDWDATGLVEPSLFAALGALQKPSWGTWNFLLQSLRNARKAQLRTGVPAARDALERARTLNEILTLLDTASPELVEAARPLAEYLKSRARMRRVVDVLTLPIALRNELAHFPPGDDSAWTAIRAALEPLIAYRAEHPLAPLAPPSWPAPWFLDDEWALNGIGKDFAVMYASPSAARPREVAERAGEVSLRFQSMLGQTGVQEQTFHRLFARLAPEDVRGVLLGDFLVGPAVARGGFAVVHVGRQLSTGRKVAIKLLHDGLPDDARARFQQEAAFLSRVAHPAIVGVISHGEEAWSVPKLVDLSSEAWFAELARGAPIKTYLALEWVDGITLEELFQRVYVAKTMERPQLAQLRTWFRDAAEALAAVHAAGLVHRDIKPGNMMIASDGALRLMDFGIARSADENRTLVTAAGDALGTPAYMSPEQTRARDADAEVGPASDIYSLCATFYELFTGTRLYDHDRETQDTVRTRKLAGDRPTSPRKLAAGVPWELETILLGGLQPELADRYTSAAVLARDVAHWERDQPIEYRRPGIARRLRLAYRRHRTVTTIVVVALAILAGYGTWSLRRIVVESDRADRERDAALEKSNRAVLAQARGLVARDPASALAWLAQLEPDAPGWGAARVLAADALSRPLPTWAATAHIDGAAPISADWVVDPKHRRVFVWAPDYGSHRHPLWMIDLARRSVTAYDATAAWPSELGACDDGKRVAGYNDDGLVVLDLDTKAVTRTKDGFAATWKQLVACNNDFPVATDGDTLDRWDAATGAPVRLAEHVVDARPTADHLHAISHGADGTITWWDLATGNHELVGTFGRVRIAHLSDDGRVLVIGGTDADGMASHYSIFYGGKQVKLEPTGSLYNGATIAVSRDGSHVAVATAGTVVVHAGTDYREARPFVFAGQLRQLVFSDDARWLIANGERTVAWDLETEVEYTLASGDKHERVAFVGGDLVTWSKNGELRTWSLPQPRRVALWPSLDHALSPDHAWLVVEDGMKLRRIGAGVDEGTELPEQPRSEEEEHVLLDDSVASDGSLVAAVRHSVWLWPRGGAWKKLGDHSDPAMVPPRVRWAANGHAVSWGGPRAIEWTDRGPHELVAIDGARVADVTRDLHWAVIAAGGGVRLVDLASHAERVLPGATDRELAFSRDGRRLVTGATAGLIVWDVASQRPHAIAAPARASATLSDDGRRIAIGGPATATVVDVDSALPHVLASGANITDFIFDATGDRLITGSIFGGTTRMWDIDSGESRVIAAREVVAASPGEIVVRTAYGFHRLVDDLPADPCALLARIQAAGFVLDATAGLVIGAPAVSRCPRY